MIKIFLIISQFKEYYSEKIVGKLTDSATPVNIRACHGI